MTSSSLIAILKARPGLLGCVVQFINTNTQACDPSCQWFKDGVNTKC